MVTVLWLLPLVDKRENADVVDVMEAEAMNSVVDLMMMMMMIVIYSFGIGEGS